MSEPFWRAFRPGVRLPMRYKPGLPMVTMFNDGNGWRPVTDIEWTMFMAFARLDGIVRDGHAALADILNQGTVNA